MAMGLAERLARWRGDVVAWAQENLWITRPDRRGGPKPLVLEEHQKRFLQEATRRDRRGELVHKTVVASWPKREGKSMCVAILIAWRLCCYRDQACFVLANSERQAQSNIYDELVGFFKNSPVLQAYVAEDEIERRKLSVPELGNVVECRPCNWRTVQGVAVTGILAVDELHAVPDIKAYNYLAGQTEAIDAQVCISSQAGEPVTDNAVWRLYEARDEPHILFDYSQEHLAAWAIRLAEKQRAELLPAEFNKLHRNAWGGLGEKLFLEERVLAAALDYREPRTRAEWVALRKAWGWQYAAIGVGLDRAKPGVTGDRSVWVVIGRYGRQYRVLAVWVMRTGDEAECLECWRRTREIFGRPRGIVFEEYQCADLAPKVRGAALMSPTTKRQNIMFSALYRVIDEGRFGFPAEAGWDWDERHGGVLQRELVAFEYAAGSGDTLRFGVQRGHDDTVYALGWAQQALGDVEEQEQTTAAEWALPRTRYVSRAAG
jgi:hypothetical protein